MSGLLGILNLGAGAMLAQNAGVAVTGRNLANIGTEGYSRESVDMRAQRFGAGGGVRAHGPLRSESPLLSARERTAAGSWGRADETSAALGSLEHALTSNDVNGAMASFFGAATDLSAAPLDESLRRALVAKAEALTTALRQTSESVAQAQAEANARIVDLSAEATRLAERIAEANKSLGQTPDPVLADERDLAAQKLSELVGGQARVDGDGMMRFTTPGGAVLVDGTRAAKITSQGGNVSVTDGNHVVDATAGLGGRIAGQLAFRDGPAAAALAGLDQLAFDMATKVNEVHRGGAGLDGTSGRDLFTVPGSAAGAARSLGVDPAIAADARLVGAAGPGEGAGGGSNAMALAALVDGKNAGGGARSFLEEGIRVVSDVGSAAAASNMAREHEAARSSTLAGLRDSLSGVSQDEELAKLASFQRASEAASRFVGVVNGLLGSILEIV